MSNAPLYVTKAFLPPLEEYVAQLSAVWNNNQLTNGGPLSVQFERQVSDHLGVNWKKLRYVANGTLALQLSLRALDITEGEIITTPFSYVATTSAILWERCTPIFVDINPETFNIDPDKIEAAITSNTKAIMPVHVFGNPCDVEAIQRIADKHNLKVVYDAAHAFGVTYKGRPLLDNGDISILSFHATKLFHTIEGGAIYAKDQTIIEKVEMIKRFGHEGDDHTQLGINAKATEFNAAMGLVNLQYISQIIADRKKTTLAYDAMLGSKFRRPKISENTEYNYGYYPILFESEESLLKAKQELEGGSIFARRYFYPSLSTLPYLETKQYCPIAEDIAVRILCLPLYYNINESDLERVCNIINSITT